ncbi:hypothetical protein HYH03_014565 [Edaphochlamys debaryana]|uniref:Rhodanese domain-containing protein n=1 Tax=Edaphochlamys debaryana TaxID=47281 RepID=A0A835XMT4_9CHLO|nr:hypothetical protein HYH03_014565 [Edaphochlamys debaryana]|eukprot:KAG2486766.1 hypothetical protein HYH03_014565 [Edaphochlamys debaryana]
MALKESERMLPTSPRIIDVRTRGEYDGGHIAGALHASFLPPWSWPNAVGPILAQGVTHDTELYVICLSAHRSIGAYKWLAERGYKQVKQLKGGMQRWRAHSMPEVKEAAAGESPQPESPGPTAPVSAPAAAAAAAAAAPKKCCCAAKRPEAAAGAEGVAGDEAAGKEAKQGEAAAAGGGCCQAKAGACGTGAGACGAAGNCGTGAGGKCC